jgi:hypothetical protein
MSEKPTSDDKAPKSGYGYKSHFDSLSREEAPAIDGPVKFEKALMFYTTISRVRAEPTSDESRALYAAHPLVKRYDEEVRTKLNDEDRARNTGQPSGLIRHIKRIMGWPVGEDEWEDVRDEGLVAYRESEGKGTRASKNRGIRADTDLARAVTDLHTAAKDYTLYSKFFMMYLYQRQWLPLEEQLPLWSTDGALIRTCGDTLCYDLSKPGRFILIERKTGYTEGYQSQVTHIDSCFSHTPDNEHQLQLGWMQWRLESYLRPIGAKLAACVIRVSIEKGVPRPFGLRLPFHTYFRTRYARAEEFEAENPAVAVMPRSEVPNLLKSKKKREPAAVKRAKPTTKRAKRAPLVLTSFL